MPFWRLYYHLVWSTGRREPWLTGEIEKRAYALIRAKARDLGAYVHALGGIEDHVHLVVSIPPAVAVAKLVGQVKGATTARLNQSDLGVGHCAWQDEYGAFSFDARRLPNFVAYAMSQREHHSRGSTISVLERMTPSDEIREPAGIYAAEDALWRAELVAVTV